jgi:signal transduction histidine kinase
MLRKIGKGITIVNAAAFAVVILVGGVSIFFTKDILHSAYKVQELNEDIILTNSIHSDIYNLVLDMHHLLLEEDEFSSEEAVELIEKIREKVEKYKEHELEEELSGENEELAILDEMLFEIDKLYVIKNIVDEFTATGKFKSDDLFFLEDHAYTIEELAGDINLIHLQKMSRWINESLKHMWTIFFIYLTFIAMGGLTIYTGHRALVKNVVNPIKKLAFAAIEFSKGTFDKRVKTDSHTEIGQLYQSFNDMADNIQENDEKLRRFNEELEEKVIERTAELQKTRDALIRTERIAAVGQVAAGVTHEIKNPLNSLAINTQMLIKDLSADFEEDSSLLKSASLIKHEINRINNILEEFVKYAKFPEPKFFENNINQVIEEVADLISDNAKESGVDINLSLQDDIPILNIDARQFKEIFLNLFQNAIKAMKDSGRLEIRSQINDDNVIIDVTDTGEGVPEGNLDRIFTPFFSTREGGLGLGLPIVKRIIESHGGEISCKSRVNEGTAFKIVLPVERGDS